MKVYVKQMYKDGRLMLKANGERTTGLDRAPAGMRRYSERKAQLVVRDGIYWRTMWLVMTEEVQLVMGDRGATYERLRYCQFHLYVVLHC